MQCRNCSSAEKKEQTGGNKKHKRFQRLEELVMNKYSVHIFAKASEVQNVQHLYILCLHLNRLLIASHTSEQDAYRKMLHNDMYMALSSSHGFHQIQLQLAYFRLGVNLPEVNHPFAACKAKHILSTCKRRTSSRRKLPSLLLFHAGLERSPADEPAHTL